MTERYFSPADVDALIPALTAIMERVMPAHAESASIRERMQAEQQRIALSGGGRIDPGAWRADRGRLEQLAVRMQEGLDKIQALGGAPKDLSLGLVDFRHLRGGHAVNLCWKYGEATIGFWHGLDEGYTGRKPL